MGCAKVVIVHRGACDLLELTKSYCDHQQAGGRRDSPVGSNYDAQFEEKGTGVEEYFAIFRCKQQSKPISYTHTVAALLRFAQSFANDFNIILTIGTTRRSRGVE